MKKLSCLTALLLFILTSFMACEKEANVNSIGNPSEKDTTKYEVSFKISAFKKQEVPMGELMSVGQQKGSITISPDSNAVFTYLKELDYFVYNESGDLIWNNNQINGTQIEQFVYYGEAFFALPKGQYKMIVIGSMGGLTFTDSTKYSTAYMEPGEVVEDIFYKEVAFDVDGVNNIKETITLERIVGSLEVRQREMVDDFWVGKPEIRIRSVIRYPFDKNNEYFYPIDQLFLPQISGEVIPWQTIDFVSSGFILPDRSGNFDPQAFLYIPGSRFNVIAEGHLRDIVIKPNTKVILTGSITGTEGQQYFDFNADTAWNNIEQHDLELSF